MSCGLLWFSLSVKFTDCMSIQSKIHSPSDLFDGCEDKDACLSTASLTFQGIL